MGSSKQTSLAKDAANNKLRISREFNAPLPEVWQAWTEKEFLEQWWAPKPWKSVSKEMDFREGGHWLYGMVGPDGTTAWAKVEFETIAPEKSFTAVDFFSDEKGRPNSELQPMHWKNSFSHVGSGTRVETEITFASEEDMNRILEMGFEEGFAAAHQNLDELLEKK